MDWDAIGAIGEVVGALAVVLTLIYFSRQIRSMQASASAENLTNTQNTEIELRKLGAEYAETITKGNAGQELSDADRYRIRNVYDAHVGFAFHYGLIEARSGSQRHIRALTFAQTLVENPVFLSFFRTVHWPTPEYVEWKRIVEKKLSELHAS